MAETDTTARWKFGLIALGIGAVLLLASIALVGWLWNKNEAALGAVMGTIGTIVGAYFGLQVGGAEAEDAKKERDKANDEKNKATESMTNAMQAATVLAGLAPPDQSTRVLEHFGISAQE